MGFYSVFLASVVLNWFQWIRNINEGLGGFGFWKFTTTITTTIITSSSSSYNFTYTIACMLMMMMTKFFTLYLKAQACRLTFNMLSSTHLCTPQSWLFSKQIPFFLTSNGNYILNNSQPCWRVFFNIFLDFRYIGMWSFLVKNYL